MFVTKCSSRISTFGELSLPDGPRPMDEGGRLAAGGTTIYQDHMRYEHLRYEHLQYEHLQYEHMHRTLQLAQ